MDIGDGICLMCVLPVSPVTVISFRCTQLSCSSARMHKILQSNKHVIFIAFIFYSVFKACLTVSLRASRNFPTKKYYIRSFLCFLSVFFPVFTCQIARYQLRKDRKTSLKETPKPDPNKIYTGC